MKPAPKSARGHVQMAGNLVHPKRRHAVQDQDLPHTACDSESQPKLLQQVVAERCEFGMGNIVCEIRCTAERTGIISERRRGLSEDQGATKHIRIDRGILRRRAVKLRA